jgi:hypothetical protein
MTFAAIMTAAGAVEASVAVDCAAGRIQDVEAYICVV